MTLRPTLLTLTFFLLAPASAHACWDGVYAQVGDVTYMGGAEGDGWSPDEAERLARWLGRLDALLPEGDTLEIEWSSAVVGSAEGETTLTWDGRDFARLFDALATALAVPRPRARVARALETPIVTVQIAASRDRSAAEALAAAMSARGEGEHGFVEFGGFPADNPTAHVIDAEVRGAQVHRVVVGAFTDRRAAEAVAAALRPDAFVRAL